LIELNHPNLDIKTQCETLGLARSSYYYLAIKASNDDLSLMRRIEELHYEQPELGYRKIYVHLKREGYTVNEKKIERLWRMLGFKSILPSPNLSKPSKSHPRYPYLLNEMQITYPGQVFSTDITFIPLPGGFVYLASVTDWFSRYIMSWEISNTLTTDFCLAACENALKKMVPTHFNMDQGAQFTSMAFLSLLTEHGIKISMDGRGRAVDNVYQERGWWSLKYEKIYPGRYGSMRDLIEAIKEYYHYYNHQRPHQALLYATPHEILTGIPPKYSKGRYEGFIVKKAGNISRNDQTAVANKTTY
jgi:putative transposase